LTAYSSYEFNFLTIWHHLATTCYASFDCG